MELLDEVPLFPPTQWTKSLPPNTLLEWTSKGSPTTASMQEMPWWSMLAVGLVLAIFGALLTVDLLIDMLRKDHLILPILSFGLLFLGTGLGLGWMGFQHWRYAATIRCGASTQHLYVWSPQTGLQAWAWKDLNELQCKSSPTGTFSLSHWQPDEAVEVYLFKDVKGTREDFKQLVAFQKNAQQL